MALTRIPRIDGLISGGGVPLAQGDPDREAVCLLQDLLRCQGYTRIPDARSPGYGTFGNLTREAVLGCRAAAGLDARPQADAALLLDLARRPASRPAASRGYLALALDYDWDDTLAAVAATSLFESGGRFDCVNRNTDRAGLSFGIIQWAQRPGRLHELLQGFQTRQPAIFARLAVDGPGLLAHTALPNGGVERDTGRTVDPRYALVDPPWLDRFLAMGRDRDLQKVQVDMAVEAYRASLARLLPKAPEIRSERGCAFLLDLANQHGDGGAASIYAAVRTPGMAEADLLAAMQRESVRRVTAQFGEGSREAASTFSRREFFRTVA
ncbi:MAG: hypothetical protein ACE15B_17355 [Bryobacteraceae bacterium]